MKGLFDAHLPAGKPGNRLDKEGTSCADRSQSCFLWGEDLVSAN